MKIIILTLTLFVIIFTSLAQDFPKAELKKPCPYPERTKAELEAVGGFDKPTKIEAMHIIISASKKTHGVDQHDFPAFQKRWAKLLPHAEKVTVDTAFTWPTDEQYAKADLIVFYCGMAGLNADEAGRLNTFLTKGGGAIYLHYGVNGDSIIKGKRTAVPEQLKNIGLAWQGNCGWRHGKMDLDCTIAKDPITKGFAKVKFYDETYWKLTGNLGKIKVLGTSIEKTKGEAKPEPQVWTMEVGKGRIYANILGHYSWTFDDPLARVMIMRGMAWAAGQDINRFQSIYTLGAHYKE
jgi:type 1 glutamine amidotransferase